jgi:glycosyltransferase involved in cell wall biosynthesis
MKVLVDCSMPFNLAHGGQAIQIERTMAALVAAGIEIEPLRWWDSNQEADIIHYFGRMPAGHIRFAQQKGIKVVMAELLTAQGSRSPSQLFRQKIISRSIQRLAPPTFTSAFYWDSYKLADAFIANTSWEKKLMQYLFGAAAERTFVVPNGVEDVFFQSPPANRGKWLVCTATITERKRILELAQAAVAAKTPVWIIGKPYGETNAYAQTFLALTRQYPGLVRYEGSITDRVKLAEIYHDARGFVLLSTMETRSLSSEEAAAAGCPLLLSDLPWARSTFGTNAVYAPVPNSVSKTAAALKKFYESAPSLPPPPKPLKWSDVARQIGEIYKQLLKSKP